MDELQELLDLLPLLIPIFLVQIALVIIALWDLWKRKATRGPKWLWVLVILLVNFIGPIIYLVVGREDE
jgi:Phospholipase_D-nuclease N-terminal/Family of unknown function (DUF5652)